MKSVNYTIYHKLDCTCDDPVIICLDSSLTASGAPFIEGTLAYFSSTLDSCGRTKYNYAITYDEAQLDDPTYSLLESDIDSVVCKDCIFTYIDYVASQGGQESEDWHIIGNAGTVLNTNFIGTTDNVGHDVRVNNVRVRRSMPDTYCPRIMDGYYENITEAPGSGVLSGGMPDDGPFTDQFNSIYVLDFLYYDTECAVICGGFENKIEGGCAASVIAGGQSNVIDTPAEADPDFMQYSWDSGILCGFSNSISETDTSAIICGDFNQIAPNYDIGNPTSFGGNIIAGGRYNDLWGTDFSGVLTGTSNLVTFAEASGIVAGSGNQIGTNPSNSNHFVEDCHIGSGSLNLITGTAFCGILSGYCNQITASFYSTRKYYNAILGGARNVLADTIGSSILGGYALQLGSYSVGFEGLAFTRPSPPATLCDDTLTNLSNFTNIAYFGSVDIWVGNVDNSASKVKFFQANSSRTYSNAYYSSFEAQAQQANIEYKWPAVQGVQGQVLKIANVAGNVLTLEWANDLT